MIAERSLDLTTGEAAFTYRLGEDEFTERLVLDTEGVDEVDLVRLDAARGRRPAVAGRPQLQPLPQLRGVGTDL